MPDSSRGRKLILTSLVVLFALTTALGFLGGEGLVMRYGRPIAMALACVLVLQRRVWALAVVAFLSLGVLLAGPIAAANGVGPGTVIGVVFWLVSLMSAGS